MKQFGVAIKEFAGLKAKMYPCLVDDNSQTKKTKGCKQKYCCENKS